MSKYIPKSNAPRLRAWLGRKVFNHEPTKLV